MVRIAIIDKKKCHPDECQNLCMKKCPVNKMGEECITLQAGKAHICEPLCVGCGICPRICPFGALDIINLPEELDEPIHRFGENQFSLYNLPVPVFGKVVGLLGRNGIGKSTAMQILAGVLQPNFGNLSQKKCSTQEACDKLIEYFKGTEAQAYFEKLKKEEIVVSFKLQQVELIPKTYSGTVGDLLNKINEQSQERFEEILSILDITHIVTRDITHISGGELQRVAIAACVLKKANVYFFDEPTSYLDIKQRLKISAFIKSLADEDHAVMVIEHDLIILDHVTDYIHLLYGKESAYGIVSGVKATKNGINTYLSGFLKEENVRFRDHEITFERSASQETISSRELFSWNDFSTTFGEFSLTVNSGKLFAHDVVGILGENGIGKTSLVKEWVKAAKDLQTKNELYGDESFTPTSSCIITPNETITDLRVAYKPQYIPVSDELVRLYLQDALKYEIQLIRPLHLEPLLDKQLDQLSGGELQRVVIAKTLAEDAHIYFLDEPSAYLDVEQRLSLSKVIREMMDIKRGSAFVVDHDLLVIDYISKRLLVFDGQPAIRGESKGPFSMKEGMNEFLQDLIITFRRDENNNRPRVNKLGSQKDKEQKASGNLYYAD